MSEAGKTIVFDDYMFRYFFEHCPAGLTLIDLEGCFIKANPKFCSMLGYEPGELSGTHWSDFTNPEDVEAQRLEVAKLVENKSYHLRKRYHRSDGGTVWVDLYGTLVHDEEDTPLCHIGLIYDCSDEVSALDSLIKSEARFKAIIDRIPGGIACVDREHRLQFIDATTIATLNIDFALGSTDRLEDLGLPEALVSPCIRSVDQVFASGKPARLELAWLDRVYRLELRLENFDTEEDLVLAIVRDITSSYQRRIENERRLARAEALSRASVELAEAGLDIDRVLKVIVRLAATAVGEGAIISLLSDDGVDLDGVAVFHPDETFMELGQQMLRTAPFRPTGLIFSSIKKTAGTFLRNDLGPEFLLEILSVEHQDVVAGIRLHHLLSAPIRVEQRVIGVINVVSMLKDRPYTSEDAALLQGIADRAGLIIAMARLFQENRRQATELKHLNEALEKQVDERTKELEQVNRKLHELATHDFLTGLPNRRQLDERLDSEIRRCKRNRHRLAVLMIDIDYFKAYNDTYGHQEGDVCLRKVALTLAKYARRATDLVARYGGEEFVAVMVELEPERAYATAQSIRQAVEDLRIEHLASGISPWVTISIGVVCAVPELEEDMDWWVRTADEALYASKNNGRNRVTLWQPPSDSKSRS